MAECTEQKPGIFLGWFSKGVADAWKQPVGSQGCGSEQMGEGGMEKGRETLYY